MSPPTHPTIFSSSAFYTKRQLNYLDLDLVLQPGEVLDKIDTKRLCAIGNFDKAVNALVYSYAKNGSKCFTPGYLQQIDGLLRCSKKNGFNDLPIPLLLSAFRDALVSDKVEPQMSESRPDERDSLYDSLLEICENIKKNRLSYKFDDIDLYYACLLREYEEVGMSDYIVMCYELEKREQIRPEINLNSEVVHTVDDDLRGMLEKLTEKLGNLNVQVKLETGTERMLKEVSHSAANATSNVIGNIKDMLGSMGSYAIVILLMSVLSLVTYKLLTKKRIMLFFSYLGNFLPTTLFCKVKDWLFDLFTYEDAEETLIEAQGVGESHISNLADIFAISLLGYQTYDCSLIKKFTSCMHFPRLREGLSNIMDVVLSVFQSFVSFITGLFTSKEIVFYESGDADLNVLLREVSDYVTRHDTVASLTFEDAQELSNILNKINKLQFRGRLKQRDTVRLNAAIKLLHPLKMMYENGYWAGKSSRVEPLAIIFMGPSSIGKTALMHYLLNVCTASNLPPNKLKTFHDHPESQHYAWRSSHDHHDGYNEQFSVSMNEFLSMKDDGKLQEALDFLYMIDNSPLPLHSAGLERKDKQYFTSAMVWGSTNNMDFDWLETIRHKKALLNRMHIQLRCTVKPEYANRDGSYNTDLGRQDKWQHMRIELVQVQTRTDMKIGSLNHDPVVIKEFRDIDDVRDYINDSFNRRTKKTTAILELTRSGIMEALKDRRAKISDEVQKEEKEVIDDIIAKESRIEAQMDSEHTFVTSKEELIDDLPDWALQFVDSSELLSDKSGVVGVYSSKCYDVDAVKEWEETIGKTYDFSPRDHKNFGERYELPKYYYSNGIYTASKLVGVPLACYAGYKVTTNFIYPYVKHWVKSVANYIAEKGWYEWRTYVSKNSLISPFEYAVYQFEKGEEVPNCGNCKLCCPKDDTLVHPLYLNDPVSHRMFMRTYMGANEKLNKPGIKDLFDREFDKVIPEQFPHACWNNPEFAARMAILSETHVDLSDFGIEGVDLMQDMIAIVLAKHDAEKKRWMSVRMAYYKKKFFEILQGTKDTIWGTVKSSLEMIKNNKKMALGILGLLGLGSILFMGTDKVKEKAKMAYDKFDDIQYGSILRNVLYKKVKNTSSRELLNEFERELQSSSGMSKDNPKPKVKGKAKVNVIPEGEDFITNNMEQDVQSDQIARKILRRNMYYLKLPWKDTPSGTVLMVRGRLGIMPDHFHQVIQEALHEGNISEDNPVILRPCVQSGVEGIIDRPWYPRFDGDGEVCVTPEWADRDLVFVKFPDTVMRVHADIVKYFLPKDMMDKIPGVFKGSLYINRYVKEGHSLTVERGSIVRKLEPEYTFGGFTYDNGDTFAYKFQTDKGDCGSLLVLNNKMSGKHKLLGIHTCGGQVGIGFSVAITQEELSRCVDYFDIKYDVNEDDVDPDVSAQGAFAHPLVNSITHKSHMSQTQIIPSPIHNGVGAVLKYPARLRSFQGLDGITIDPWYKADVKYNASQFVPNRTLYYALKNFIAEKFTTNTLEGFKYAKLFTFEEAVKGIHGERLFKGQKRTTSSGARWSLKGPSGKKSDIYGKDGDYNLDTDLCKELRIECDLRLEEMKHGFRTKEYYADNLKDETRDIEKVNSGSTRLFSGAEIVDLTNVRRLEGGFQMSLMNNKILNGIAIGVNPYSYDWHLLVKYMCFGTPESFAGVKMFLDGDFKNFDGSQSPAFLMIYNFTCRMYYDDEYDLARKVSFQNQIDSHHVHHGHITQWSGCIPSGGPRTAFNNSITNIAYWFYSVIHIVFDGNIPDDTNTLMHELVEVDKWTRIMVLGDDRWISVHPESIYYGLVTHKTLTKVYTLMGLGYTDSSKTLRDVGYKDLSAITFLKRSVTKDPVSNHYIAPLDLGSIMKSLQWCKKKDQYQEDFRQTVITALRELSLHDKAIFDERTAEIISACRNNMNWQPPRRTWKEYRAECLSLEDFL